MKLQDQVCLLEQGRRLKELGITAYPLFTHVENFAVPNDCHIKLTTQTQSWKRYRRIEDGGVIKYFPAFTVAELGVMLPPQYTSYKISEYGKQFVDGNFWMVETDYRNECEVCTESSTKNLPDTAATTEAEARAALLIVLLETGKITASEANQRLSNP